jgi:SPP1 gp7 family putative phage head morphogenesis protein
MKFENRAEALVWNSLLHSYHLGLGKALKESGFKRFVWATAMSEKNCKVCLALNGVEFSADEIEKIFPAHIHCICSLMPKV